MTLDPETFAQLAPADRLMHCAFDNVCVGGAADGVGGLALSGNANRRGPGVEPQRAARGACHRVRAGRRRRALPRPRRAIRAGAHLGAASAAAPAVRPPLGAHSGRVGAAASSRRCTGASAAGRRGGRALGSAEWRRAMGLGRCLAARAVSRGLDGREGPPALAAARRVMRVLQIVHGFPPHGRGGAELYAEAVATRPRVTVWRCRHGAHARSVSPTLRSSACARKRRDGLSCSGSTTPSGPHAASRTPTSTRTSPRAPRRSSTRSARMSRTSIT